MKQKAIDFVKQMVEDFGVNSCFDNIDEENTLEEEGIWFECPVCGEPILIFEDWSLEEVMEHCPICEEEYND